VPDCSTECACLNSALVMFRFSSHGHNVPAFSVGSAPLSSKDSLKYPGMVFYRTHNITKPAEHMLGLFMAGCHRIRHIAREHHLMNRPHTLLWFAKCYAIPVECIHYFCQYVRLSGLGHTVHELGQRVYSPLQTAHVFPQRCAWPMPKKRKKLHR